MGGDTAGRVVITWPAAHTPPTALWAWGCAIADADTGEQLLDVVALSIQIGSPRSSDLIEVELTRLVDADDGPIGAGAQPVFSDAFREYVNNPARCEEPSGPGSPFRTGTFRYVVAEMRVAESPPARASGKAKRGEAIRVREVGDCCAPDGV